MVEFGHYFLLHLFLLYAACLRLGCYVDHLIGACDAIFLLKKALYSSELKKSENIAKSSKNCAARVALTLIYLVGVVVKIEPILRLLIIIVGCRAAGRRQCDLPLQQGLLGPGEQGAHLRQSQSEGGRRRLMPLRRRRRVHTLQLQEQF